MICKTLFGTYTILKVIKEGPMGSVLLAEHNTLEIRRVIKCINKAHPDSSCLSREAHIMQKCCSEYIPRIIDIREDNENIYLIQEFIEGETLKAYLKNRNALSVSELLNLSIQMSEIMIFLHESGREVLHLDIKPENIIVTNNRLKIIDFGSAISRRENRNGYMIYGTKGFAAPEQFEGGRLSDATDLYAMGKTFEYMILYTGKVPKEYVKVVERCIRKNGSFYTSAREVRKDLGNIMKRLSTHGGFRENPLGRWYGVIGVSSENESTAFAMKLASELAQKHKKVLVLDVNPKRLLERVEEEYACTSDSQDYTFIYEGITVAKRVLPEDIEGWRGKDYDVVIADFGLASDSIPNPGFERLFLSGVHLPWTERDWIEARAVLGENITEIDCNLLYNTGRFGKLLVTKSI